MDFQSNKRSLDDGLSHDRRNFEPALDARITEKSNARRTETGVVIVKISINRNAAPLNLVKPSRKNELAELSAETGSRAGYSYAYRQA
jgi:hypothetical protein